MRKRRKIISIVQCRMSSSRLPGKVMLDIEGKPMLERVVDRVLQAEVVDEVIVSTTTKRIDKCIVDFCAMKGWSCYTGEEDDIIDRTLSPTKEVCADAVIRVTSDCPLVDFTILDRVGYEYLHDNSLEYVTTKFPPTFPHGAWGELFSVGLLEKLDKEIVDPYYREWFTLYLLENLERFKVFNVSNSTDVSYIHWEVNDHDELEHVRSIYRKINGRLYMTTEEILCL